MYMSACQAFCYFCSNSVLGNSATAPAVTCSLFGLLFGYIIGRMMIFSYTFYEEKLKHREVGTVADDGPSLVFW